MSDRAAVADIVDEDTFRDDTRLALVNALYLKASWASPFARSRTETGSFTRLDGSSSSARVDGWVGATKAYVGGLEAQFILPDEGRFDEIQSALPAVFADYDRRRTIGARLAVPRFDTRF